ncbi:DUF2235 domain-containing protein [Pseudomonas sp. CCI4.2]|uniref:DUF2235 domain-containing protein n=1 Tax=Pseudomonas sp. CCI4.2 TaxID=3048620 RepID=UPI002AC98F67|nr:DUF2235 domain-containing protein [Pseudomonas sp. CCI4.2]MEB0090207.1 DUF2235 domain-containing protein [Pseudomonas sp. CCI4.2]WPX52018.1 DUF2235 domain-containing protein [Pseudomonas sp. CCI4.2]
MVSIFKTVCDGRCPDLHVQTRGVTVRIGLFFDGTGNNRINSQIAADCRAQAVMNNNAHTGACAGRHANAASSYASDITNIARLYELYVLRPKAHETPQGLSVSVPIYVSGAGTTSGKHDSVWAGQVLGRGNTGVLAKVSEGVKKLRTVLETFQTNNCGCTVEGLELDLFGFSRGAAAARHFANEVLKQEKGALGPLLKLQSIAWGSDFAWGSGSVRLKVIGLFDTVAAIGGFSDFGNTRDNCNRRVNLYLPPGSAQQVLHLVAGDEQRRNFALNSVTPGWPKEIVLPGAHSDIGGGYHLNVREKVLLSRPRRSVVNLNTAFHETVAWRESQADLQTIDAREWLDPLDAEASLSIENDERLPNAGSNTVGVKAVVAAVSMNRRVYGHLSRVYLRVMHELASAEGVPLEPVPDSPALSLVPELQVIAQKLIAYAKGGPYTLDEGEQRLLRRRFIHRSAHWSALVGSGASRSHAIFVHAPEPGGRICHPNVGKPGYPE